VQGGAQLFFQWLNQSYNACFNFANRNASGPVDTTALAASYISATATALLAAHTLGKLVTKMQAKVGADLQSQSLGVKLLSRGLPWFAVAAAGSANVLAMRYKEAM
jgi:hypothetical protein